MRLRDPKKQRDHTKQTSATMSVQKDKTVDQKCTDDSEQSLEPIRFDQLYRFTTMGERLSLLLGIFAALIGSTVFPITNIILGSMAQHMVKRELGEIECNGSSPVVLTSSEPTSVDSANFFDELITSALYLIALGFIQLVMGYLFVSIFNRVAEKMASRLRRMYLEALLRQNIGWYDTVQDRSFVSQISEDIGKIQEAAEKLGLFIYYLFNCALSLALALYYCWLPTFVIVPAILVVSAVISTFQSRMAVREQRAYAKSGSIAQEVLANIKTVMAFGGQGKELQRYEQGLVFAISAGKRRGLASAIGNGILWVICYFGQTLALWYAIKLILDGERTHCGIEPTYNTQNLITMFLNILVAATTVGQCINYLDIFAIGRGTAAAIYNVIERVPGIDSYRETGLNPGKRLTGSIEFRNVTFSYPSRQDVQVLKGLNIKIKPGSTVAVVGNSGCGKSTCLQLLQRFYDPDSGAILVDGHSIKDYNIKWYRSQLGVVSQEPILFNTTIAENIRYGRDGVTQKELEEACRLANAHHFISRLPNQYDTIVGDRGAQLSGGQKQRIAIARALVRNPAILLLDEATSALDTQSERLVQEALDNVRLGRTTLIVAHRLSTIRSADVIVSIEKGQVVEVGSHAQLISQKGLYHRLVQAQMSEDPTDEDRQGREESVREKINVFTSNDVDLQEDTCHFEEIPKLSSDKVPEEVKSASFIFLMKLNAQEWPLITIGVISAIAHGIAPPIAALYVGEVMEALSIKDVEEVRRQTNFHCIVFLIIGVFAGITSFVSVACFSSAGEILTNRLRKLSFKSMLQQELAWHDQLENSVGALCSRLSGDSASIRGATGGRLHIVVHTLATVASSAGISLYIMPRLGAVALAFVPLILLATYKSGKIIENRHVKEKSSSDEASRIAFQAVSNIRTVASLCSERTFVSKYCSALVQSHKKVVAHSHLLGLTYGFSQASISVAGGVIMYYGAILIRDEDLNYKLIFAIAESVIWNMMALGNALAFAPNYNKAKSAGDRILSLLQRKPALVNSPGVGLQIRNCQGSVIYDKTEFHYPTRPEVQVFKGLSFGIEPSLHIGICGPSGSGKTTCIQLILRCYDPTAGQVLLDETDIGALNVNALRSQMAIVSQEPALFDRTVAENIAYGDNSRDVEMTEIIEAARSANIHDFISSLPGGYSTKVGDMGVQLSGGQKQRVAIARALIRNPKLLILDEATSALDTESEKIVQAALSNASIGRTSITIAHRLSSIQNADRILVINNGKLSESGTHAELLEKHGIYFKLWCMQRHGVS